jgi:ribulose-phosphate 3-epimerase
MSVNPGFGGQDFIPSALVKIKALKAAIKTRGLAALISVDGGVKPGNAVSIVEAGADILVMGSAFFRSGDYAGLVKKLRQEIG